VSTIQETKSEAQTLLDALNATAGNGHVYEFVHDFKVDGRSKEGKTFKKLQGYWDVKVHPVKGAWSTYFLVIWNEVKEEYADTLADFDVEKAATAKLVRASLVDEDGENLWFCLTTDNEQGFAWLVENDRESLKRVAVSKTLRAATSSGTFSTRFLVIRMTSPAPISTPRTSPL
jgi:hypothetical protein